VHWDHTIKQKKKIREQRYHGGGEYIIHIQ